MKTFSKLALAAMLATGVSGLAMVAPVAAKDKKADAAAAPGFKLSKPVQAAAAPAQAAIKAGTFDAAEPLVAQVEAAATTDDDKYVAAALRYDLVNQKLAAQQAANPKAPIDQTVLAKPLDALIAAANTPPADRARYYYRRGNLAYNGGQYDVAAKYYQQAKQGGYDAPDFDLQMAKARFQGGDVNGGLTDLESAVKVRETGGQKAPEEYYRYAIAQANKAKLAPQTLAWLKRYVAAYPTNKNWRDVVLVYGIQQDSLVHPDKGQIIDLFRLLRTSNALADQALFEEYAQDVYDRGLPYETSAVIKEGRASGKLATTNKNMNDLLALATSSAAREGSLAGTEKQALASANGKLASQTADAYLAQGNYPKAVELYRAALTKGGVANVDEVNTHLGIALARSGDKAGAATAFAAITTEPRVGIASLWTTWLQVGSVQASAVPAAGS